jgi:hypothetical protein
MTSGRFASPVAIAGSRVRAGFRPATKVYRRHACAVPHLAGHAARPSGIQKFFTGALICLLLFLASASSASALHHWLHPDAATPGHECVVSQFASGHVLVASAPPLVEPPAPVFVDPATVPPAQPPATNDLRLASSRAPPSALLPQPDIV